MNWLLLDQTVNQTIQYIPMDDNGCIVVILIMIKAQVSLPSCIPWKSYNIADFQR